MTATPKIFVSFFGKETPGEFSANAARLTAPLLIVSGSADPTQRGIDAVYARAPHDPHNAHVTVNSDHIGTPNAATAAVVAWLKIQAIKRSSVQDERLPGRTRIHFTAENAVGCRN